MKKTVEMPNGRKMTIEKGLTIDGKQREIRKFFNKEGKLHRKMGAAVIVFQDGKLIEEKFYNNGKLRGARGIQQMIR